MPEQNQDFVSDYLKATMPQIISPADVSRQEQGAVSGTQSITSGLEQNAAALQQQRMSLVKSMPRGVKPPSLANMPDAPKQDFTDPIKAFQNPAVVIATLGSLFTRAPMTAAFNAGAAAMTAYHKGEAEVFAQKRQEWKDNVEKTIAQNNIEMEKYRAVLENARLSTQEKIAEMNALAAGYGDQVQLAAAKKGDIKVSLDLLEARVKAQESLRNSMLQYEMQERQRLMTMSPDRQAMNKYVAEHPDATAEEMQKFVKGMKTTSVANTALERYLAEHPDASPEMIQRFNQVGRGGGRSAIMVYTNKYLEEHPDASADDIKRAMQTFTTQTTAQNRFLSGPQGNTIRSLNVVVSHLQTMQELSEALKNGNIPLFNRLAQEFSEQTGNPAPTNFDTAKQIVGTEIIKALGVMGAGTEAERREAAESFNRARSPEQLSGAIKVAQQLLGGQLDGLRLQFKTSTGLPISMFDDMLKPETREFLSGRRSSKPLLENWLPAARQANPGVSDDQLRAAYEHKYGDL